MDSLPRMNHLESLDKIELAKYWVQRVAGYSLTNEQAQDFLRFFQDNFSEFLKITRSRHTFRELYLDDVMILGVIRYIKHLRQLPGPFPLKNAANRRRNNSSNMNLGSNYNSESKVNTNGPGVPLGPVNNSGVPDTSSYPDTNDYQNNDYENEYANERNINSMTQYEDVFDNPDSTLEQKRAALLGLLATADSTTDHTLGLAEARIRAVLQYLPYEDIQQVLTARREYLIQRRDEMAADPDAAPFIESIDRKIAMVNRLLGGAGGKRKNRKTRRTRRARRKTKHYRR